MGRKLHNQSNQSPPGWWLLAQSQWLYPEHFSDRWTISRETSLYPLNPSGYLVVSNACHLSWGGRHHCIRSKRGSASVRSSPRVQKRFSALSERASLCLSLSLSLCSA